MTKLIMLLLMAGSAGCMADICDEETPCDESAEVVDEPAADTEFKQGAFAEVSGLDSETEVIGYQDGSDLILRIKKKD